jgi:hypothetical protein
LWHGKGYLNANCKINGTEEKSDHDNISSDFGKKAMLTTNITLINPLTFFGKIGGVSWNFIV